MSKLLFLNYDAFLRYFEPKNKEEQKLLRNFFEKLVNGRIKAFTTTHSLIKLAEELERTGRWTREEISYNLRLILLTPNLKLNFRDVFEEALEIYSKRNISFLNAYHCAIMRRMNSEKAVTFSEDFEAEEKLNLKEV
jgi:predicted nucleic-acid-binding protein